MKNIKTKKELLEDWSDVYGINFNYRMMNDIVDNSYELETSEVYESHLTVGFNAHSLRKNGEADLMFIWDMMSVCEFVDEFLEQYQSVYTHYLISKINGDLFLTEDEE